MRTGGIGLALRRSVLAVCLPAVFASACAPHPPVQGPPPGRIATMPALAASVPAEVGMHPSLAATLDSILREGMAAGAAPGASLVVGRHGRIVYMGSHGRIDAPTDAPAVSDSTLFDMASLTKVVAGTTAAMILEQEGRLDLDLPVRHYLPDFDAPDKADITVRMLFSHSSGFVSGAPLWRDHRTREGFMRVIRERPLVYAPGDSAIYSDWNLILGGWIIEEVGGQPLDAFLEERVWRPLGMRDTGFNPLGDTRVAEGEACTVTLRDRHPLLARIAATEADTVYRRLLIHGIVHDENACALGGVAGHAGLFSSARDLAVFAQMMLNGGHYDGVRIVDENTVARWTARQNLRSSRALGWDTPSGNSSAGRFFSPRSFGHTGFTGTSIWMDPERGLFVVLLTNRVNPTRQNTRHEPLRRDIADAVQAAVMDAPLVEWRPRPSSAP